MPFIPEQSHQKSVAQAFMGWMLFLLSTAQVLKEEVLLFTPAVGCQYLLYIKHLNALYIHVKILSHFTTQMTCFFPSAQSNSFIVSYSMMFLQPYMCLSTTNHVSFIVMGKCHCKDDVQATTLHSGSKLSGSVPESKQ